MPYPSVDRPEGLPEAFAEAWNARDPDRLADLFEEDAEFVNVVGLWWHDRAAIRAAHAYGLKHLFDRSRLTVRRTAVKPLAEGVAVVHARMRLKGQTPVDDVEAPGVRTTVFTFVVRRGPDGWQCAAAQNTDVVPGAETHVVDDRGQLRAADYRDPEGKG